MRRSRRRKREKGRGKRRNRSADTYRKHEDMSQGQPVREQKGRHGRTGKSNCHKMMQMTHAN